MINQTALQLRPRCVASGRRFSGLQIFLFLLLALGAFAAPPVITVAPALHFYYNPEDRGPPQFGFLIQASNAPTGYDATGLPAGATVNHGSGLVGGAVSTPSASTVVLSATNADGTGTATTRLLIHPAVLSVATSRGDFTTGQTCTVTLGYNAPMNVTGRPGVTIMAGTQTKTMTYASGTGTATLVFSYTVAAGDSTGGEEISILRVEPNGGGILDGNGLDATPSLPLRFFRSGITFGQAPVLTSATSATLTRGDSFTYQITANNTPDTFAVGALPAGFAATATGFGGTATTAGTFPISVSATNRYGTGTATVTLTVRDPSPPSPPPPAPVTPVTVASGSATGTVNQSFTYTVTTTGAPTAVTAVNLPPGLAIGNSGAITGVPTTAGTFNATVTATNVSGGSGSGAIAITINAPPSTPPSSPPPPPPPAALVAQTVTFTAPGTIVVGQPVTLVASASSGLPVSFSLVSGNATLSGNRLTPNDTGAVVVRALQAGSGTYASATADLTLSAGRGAQAIDFVSPVSSIIVGQPVRLSATASSGLPVTFTVVSGPATIDGDLLTVTGTAPVVIRATQAGSASVGPAASDVTITGAVRAAQRIDFAAAPAELLTDRTLALAATSTSGLPITFELVSGPARLDGATLVPTGAAGVVTVRARQAGNDAFGPVDVTRTITVLAASRLINLSSRVSVRDGDASRSFIAGFVVSGSAPKRMLVRAVGPALADFGVQSTLANPRLRVLDPAGRVLAENDDWSGADVAAAFARLGAFGLPAGGRDAALVVTLPPGAYALEVVANGGAGVALAEIYDASDAPSVETQQLVNLSTRAYVDTGESVLTAGFVVTGSVPKRVLVRGIGPALAAFGVPGALADPVLKVYQGSAVIAENDDWQSPRAVDGGQPAATAADVATAASAAGAFPLAAGSKDAALIVTLPPGAYTAAVSGAGGTAGAGLVEVYEIAETR